VGYTYRHTDWWERFMKYGVETGLGAMMCIPSAMKFDSGIEKPKGRGKFTGAHTTLR
jgi:hypothetical protein